MCCRYQADRFVIERLLISSAKLASQYPSMSFLLSYMILQQYPDSPLYVKSRHVHYRAVINLTGTACFLIPVILPHYAVLYSAIHPEDKATWKISYTHVVARHFLIITLLFIYLSGSFLSLQ